MDWKKLNEEIRPYKGIISFFVVMFVANFFWKIALSADTYGTHVSFMGVDISAFAMRYTSMVTHHASGWLNSLLGMNTVVVGQKLMVEPDSFVTIVWGCAGLKQIFIFTAILIFSCGSWLHKLWFIPLGCFFCYGLNVLRIGLLALINYNYDRETLFFCHDYLFKYLFYAIIFVFWVCWNEYNLKLNK